MDLAKKSKGKCSCAKGFTLLELLIVIGILAILATVAILVLNPAELMKRSRDSARISDLSTIKSALGVYLTDYYDPDLAKPAGFNCADEATLKSVFISAVRNTSGCPTALTGYLIASSTLPDLGKTDGTGWIPVRLTDSSTGSPLGNIPMDPSNTCSAGAHLFYAYSCSQTRLSFVLASHMESNFYKTDPNDVRAKDGGTSATSYEVGTDLRNSGPATTVVDQ